MHGLIASPLGVLIGLCLGALGAGGSVLAVPALVYVAGQSAHAATTTSLLVVGAASLVGMAAHYRAGRVRVGTGIVFGLTGIGGSIAGSELNQRLSPDLLLLAFSGLVVVAAWRMLVGCPTCTKAGEQRELSGAAVPVGRSPLATLRLGVDVSIPALLAAGTGIGFLTGLFGVGGGFVIVPALTLLLRMGMPEAIGTSLLVIAINSAVGLAARAATAPIDWGVALPFTVAAIVGVAVGKRLSSHLDAETTLRWFAVVLAVVAVYTAVRAFVGLLG